LITKKLILVNNQFGFQKGKSTIYFIYILHSIIARTLALKKKLYCCFIDYEKCFDKITRSNLFHKFITGNVRSRFVRAIEAMCNGVKVSVRYQSELSPFFTSNTGIKQGDLSSSLVFSYYVNDILSNINSNRDGICDINDVKLFFLLFADDAAFLQKRHVLYNLRQMTNIIIYCESWNLKVNTKPNLGFFKRQEKRTLILRLTIWC